MKRQARNPDKTGASSYFPDEAFFSPTAVKNADPQVFSTSAVAPGDPGVKRQDRNPNKTGPSSYSLDEALFPPIAVKNADPQVFSIEVLDQALPGPAAASGPIRDSHTAPVDFEPDEHAVESSDPFVDGRISSRGKFRAFAYLLPAILVISVLYYAMRGGSTGSGGSNQPGPATAVPIPAVTAPGALASIPASSPRPAVKPVVPPPETADARETAVTGRLSSERAGAAISLIEAVDEEAETLFSLAKEYRQLGEIDKAEQVYRRLVEEGRQVGRAALELGGLYFEQDKFAEAYRMYDLSKRFYAGANGSSKPQE